MMQDKFLLAENAQGSRCELEKRTLSSQLAGLQFSLIDGEPNI